MKKLIANLWISCAHNKHLELPDDGISLIFRFLVICRF